MIVAAMMVVFDVMMIICGDDGDWGDDDDCGVDNHGGVPQELVSYNPVTSEWVTRASMLVPRFSHNFHFSKCSDKIL